ncbi:hypothetical protein M8J77_018351 [Diaphorina citri]|nr:hypothetical protein M8J77_018351 [Diaphorina citri]
MPNQFAFAGVSCLCTEPEVLNLFLQLAVGTAQVKHPNFGVVRSSLVIIRRKIRDLWDEREVTIKQNTKIFNLLNIGQRFCIDVIKVPLWYSSWLQTILTVLHYAPPQPGAPLVQDAPIFPGVTHFPPHDRAPFGAGLPSFDRDGNEIDIKTLDDRSPKGPMGTKKGPDISSIGYEIGPMRSEEKYEVDKMDIYFD